MWTSDKESLCNLHNTIQYWAKDIKKQLKKAIKENEQVSQEVLVIVDNIIKESRVAKKKGQRMEDRLRCYKNGIEKLGFSRVGRK